MAKRDYYEVLGIPKNASKDDIKKAYRKMAIQYHPDKNPGDKTAEERFKEATEAYEILSDDQKRAAYDQFGFAGVDGMAGGQGAQDFSNIYRDFEDLFSGFGDFSSIFDNLFGGGGSRSRRQQYANEPHRGSNIRYDLEISFEQAVFGTKVQIQYNRNEHCRDCGGTGSSSGGTGRKLCPTCQGTGQVRRSTGFFSIASTCPHCGGDGFIVEKPCKTCSGTGLVKRKQTIEITIPAGIDDNRKVTVAGQGDMGPNNGPAGDLYVVVHVKPHQYFERNGADLYCAVPVSAIRAALGGEVTITTIDKKHIRVEIPAGTQHGKLLRIRGEGVPINGGKHRGDMYIKIITTVPQTVSKKGRELLEAFLVSEGENKEPQPIPLSELRNQ